ncbi:HK97-gp10 family putative phage morphogenesis protein [Effusibacillus dendaii]|uniref:HK97 gp10 family phage protein n=1 Tax=Effusibacillus dendaii TaxID=2743772 RepID=A0A7I8D8K1_9BACL|nr:HK97-gp10 family putative phage morphogenesis protein [Effusibacillus dendaii]BCJ86454.1 hypothetical protein skT53_14390 [Effusibacillus dendaii]
MSVEVDGLQQLFSGLDRLSDEMRDAIWKQIKQSAKELRKDAQSRAPARADQRLKKSIRVQYDEDALEAVIGPKVFYAHFLEFGTVQQPAQPYMTPAFENQKSKYLDALKRTVEGLL